MLIARKTKFWVPTALRAGIGSQQPSHPLQRGWLYGFGHTAVGKEPSFCFPKKTKNPNPSPIEKRFGFCCCGAPPGTRALGPLIKRNQRATIVNFQKCADSSFLSFHRKFAFRICCILCTCYSLLHPLSSRSGVQKVCKNVQSQNQPIKTGIRFLCKAGQTAGLVRKRHSQIHLFRPSIKCTSTITIHGRDLDNQTATTLHRLSVIGSEHRFLHSPPAKNAGKGCLSCLPLLSASAQHGCSFWGSPKPLRSIFRSGRTAYRCIHP